jgi:glycine/D-amino acid oxidase-like deaminating enzyme
MLREATGLQRVGDRIVGVIHEGGVVSCQNVILATGAWVYHSRAWIDFPVPVRPLHGEVLHVRLSGKPMDIFVMTARHGPILPRRDGILMVGSIGGVSMTGAEVDTRHVFDPRDERPPEYDLEPKAENRDFMLERAVRVMPAIEDAELVAHLAGVRPLCADRMPLIGAVPGLQGVYLATGHGTKGIHLAPITGQIVADLVLRGQSGLPASIAAFSPDRFAHVHRN